MASWKPTHGDRKSGGGGVFHTSCMEIWGPDLADEDLQELYESFDGAFEIPRIEQPTDYEVDKKLKERV